MTKYEELGEAYKLAVDRSRKYENDSREFGMKLLRELCNFLGCPPDRIACQPVEKPQEGKAYSIVGAMELGEDGFWHVGLLLTIEAANTFPAQQRISLHIMFKGQGHAYVLRIQPGGRDFTVRTAEPADFHAVEEAIFALVKEYLDSGLDRFLTQDSSPRKIGF